MHPPFATPAFQAAWAKWGKYLAEIGKPHRGHISEDEDLLDLGRKANGDHARALEIISQSISAGWKRLIDHKETSLPAHGTDSSAATYPARPVNGHKPAGNGGSLARALAEQRLAG